MKTLFALFFILILLTAPALAGTATITIFGTNASNAQANVTVTGDDNWINVTAWNVGGIKTFYVNVSSGTDTLTLNIANVTKGQVQEFRVNGTSKNAYQGNDTGWISFTYIQVQGNATFNIQPAINQGGYNTTWAQFWTYPFIHGVNLSTIITDMITAYGYLPLTGTTSDLDMNNKNITNVRTLNITTVNVTVLNVTDIQGNGSGISALNATNLTNPLPAINATALFGVNMTNSTFCGSGMTCTYNTNNSVTLSSSGGNATFNDASANSTQYTNTHDMTLYLKTGAEISVDSSSNVSFINLPTSGTIRNLTYDVGVANITDFIASFETASNLGGGRLGMVTFSDNNDFSTVATVKQNSIGMDLINNYRFTKNTAGTGWSNIILTPVAHTKYYVNLSRTGDQGTLIIYSDSARTTVLGTNTTTVPTTAFRYVTLLNTNYEHVGTISGYISNFTTLPRAADTIGNGNRTTDRYLNTQYINSNTKILMLVISANYTISSAGGTALTRCIINSSLPVSGNIGISKGLTNENIISQTTCFIPPNSNYSVNTTTSNGIVNLTDWRELHI